MRTTDKALAVLRLFSTDEPQWTVESAALRLGIPASSAYRYFRSLTEAGLIADFAAGRYVVGPGIIELDRVARRTDPLIVAAQPALDALADMGPPGTIILLSRIYRLQVMCVDQRPLGHGGAELSFERGRPMPLVRGSASRAILAHLPPRLLARVYSNHAADIATIGLGDSIQAFRDSMRQIRRAGFVVTFGEVDVGVIGISAPVFGPEGEGFASVSFVIPDRPEADRDVLARQVMAAASAISQRLGDKG